MLEIWLLVHNRDQVDLQGGLLDNYPGNALYSTDSVHHKSMTLVEPLLDIIDTF